MVAELRKTNTNLYDTDYNLWILDTVQKLQCKDLDNLDWENLIEEVLGLGRSDKRKLESLMTRLIEHLLKLGYWQSERNYNQNHWRREIRNFRKQIKRELKASPSLKNYLVQIFDELYQDARELLADDSGLPIDIFPEQPIATLEQVIDEDWLP
ncbi:DUF29 domain-containing protein [Synechocystis salina]|uniref:DUF29 domain-containing protein n=1 Tax=Synechocystis salina LEGE 00031 TaxID=1828736 RepID=A0ABR9VT82_9SYNC|nr:DUF29 domain-containing protein [Synechocystis salina]MBE9241097.1 DUF29 domain-containing protein [Synechocystis salina LEGE 00041]MBE9254551.1 DUF29 domain-containing protein [Synechocystis salina LEGE 00031]